MKLKSFWIKDFRNLKNQTLTFADGNYTALVGLNGSGKSNWLEALANVFKHLYDKTNFEFDFKLEFEINGTLYTSAYKNGELTNTDQFLLPDKIVACYSGEDEKLWNHCFIEHYNEFFSKMLKGESNEPEMLYLNKYSWDISLIVLLCYEDEHIHEFVKLLFGIDGEIDKRKFKVSVTLDEEKVDKFKATNVKTILLDFFKERNIRTMSEIASLDIDDEGDNKRNCQKLYFMLYSASMPDIINMPNVHRAIKTIDIDYEGLNAKSLSEGNKKQILIELATKLLGTSDTLFLFDEPDAHSHIAAKADLFKSIEESEGYSLISTHSPSFIAKMNPECIRSIANGVPNNDVGNLIKTISEISSGEMSYIDGALITSKRKILVVEGVYDLHYINRARFKLSPDYDKLSADVFSISVNGAQATKDFYRKVVRPLLTNLDRVIFLFDNDEAGRKSKEKLEEKIKNDNANDKVNLLVYTDDYSKEAQHDFYVEDYFPEASWKGYNELESKIKAHDYYSYKKAKNVADSIKSAIENHYKEFDKKEYWEGFRPLLDELMKQFGL